MATNIEMDEATYEDVNDTEFHDAIMRAWYAFDKYYSLTDEAPVYAAALLLHASRRKRYIDANWKRSWVRSVLPKLKCLWEEKYARNEEATGLTPSQQTFIAADPTEMSTKTALEWWCQEQQQSRYPRLSPLAHGNRHSFHTSNVSRGRASLLGGTASNTMG
jgi:hypothetical protein